MRKEKKELIKNYLLDEKISEEERKERFEIAWDIWEKLPEIAKEEVILLFDEIKNCIQNEEEIKNEWIALNTLRKSFYKWSGIYLFKKSWTLDSEKEWILSITLEPDCFSYYFIVPTNLFISIKKSKFIEKEKTDLNNITNRLNQNFVQGKSGNEWVWWKYLERYKEIHTQKFWLDFIGKKQEIIEYCSREILQLKKASEHLIDQAVKKYKSTYRNQ